MENKDNKKKPYEKPTVEVIELPQKPLLLMQSGTTSEPESSPGAAPKVFRFFNLN